MAQVQITTPGIRKALKKYKPNQAIGEYIWNGFDATANCVELIIDANEIGHINELKIKDNGYGIPYSELSTKFIPFFESDKEIDPNVGRNTSTVHGKNGVGRLTFFHFALQATWEIVYKIENKKYKYNIQINHNELDKYTNSTPFETDEAIGTTVRFTGISDLTSYNFASEVKLFLMQEFGWFLELNEARKFSLKIDGSNLDYSPIIGEKECILIEHKETRTPFEIKYIRWNERINNEYSRFYYIQSNNQEKHKETTLLNNKGDYFYHSVFIRSHFFDNFVFSSNGHGQREMFSTKTKKSEEFQFLIEEVYQFLKTKRKPFLKQSTDKLITDLDKDGAFPDISQQNSWERMRRTELENIIRELYQIEPKIFYDLKVEQKKTLVRLLDLLMDSDSKDGLFDILTGIVDLENSEREELAGLLKISKLSGIIKTIKLINDRYKAIAELKELVFNKNLNANEVYHLQKFIEKHYWIFGEQYHLVTAAEPKFEEALRRYIYLLRGEKTDILINHPDKNREMDIFMVRWDKQYDLIKNVVVELKHPHNVKIGEKELQQVKRYLRVIFSQPEFNANNMFWEFYLVGKEFDDSEYIEGELKNARNHGEQSLVYKHDRYKIYVKKWSEIFTEFELRHQFLNEKLELERDKLASKSVSANEIVQDNSNTAIQPPEITIPE